MKATLKFEDGRELTVDVSEEILKQLEKPVKKTGYERVTDDKYYYFDGVGVGYDYGSTIESPVYAVANYYSDKTVAENNARADKLMRQLRRFAVEHREHELDWDDTDIDKYCICYSIESHEIVVCRTAWTRGFGEIFFDTEETAKAAINEFKDELIWYFTEYKDSL